MLAVQHASKYGLVATGFVVCLLVMTKLCDELTGSPLPCKWDNESCLVSMPCGHEMICKGAPWLWQPKGLYWSYMCVCLSSSLAPYCGGKTTVHEFVYLSDCPLACGTAAVCVFVTVCLSSYGHRKHAPKIEGKFGHMVPEICVR